MLDENRLNLALSQAEVLREKLQSSAHSAEIVASFLRAKRPKSALIVAVLHSPVALRLVIAVGIVAAIWAHSR